MDEGGGISGCELQRKREGGKLGILLLRCFLGPKIPSGGICLSRERRKFRKKEKENFSNSSPSSESIKSLCQKWEEEAAAKAFSPSEMAGGAGRKISHFGVGGGRGGGGKRSIRRGGCGGCGFLRGWRRGRETQTKQHLTWEKALPPLSSPPALAYE